ncbi:MAG: 3-phosphoshikimate 1-carboxyvinyltransferase [Planctomycetota bacterium]|jgi:3-phosphoshikimate 1-carboxyvinyltransferase
MSEVREVDEDRAPRGLRPDQTIKGSLRPPGSKSLAIRSLLAAALAQGETQIACLPAGEDVEACLRVLRAAGISIEEQADGGLRVTGRSPAIGDFWKPLAALDCGESGTLARLVTAILGFCADPEKSHRIDVRGSLLLRSSDPLLDALRSAGVHIELESESGTWPLTLRPTKAGETLMLQSPVSSQELSGLLLSLVAQPATPRGRSILVMGGLPSEPYVDMTAGVLASFGARVDHVGAEWRALGPLIAPTEALEIETDASGAAVALAAGCLSGGEVRVPGFHEKSFQGDLAIVEHLGAFGCQVERQGAELVAKGRPTRAAELDLSDVPDLAPVLAAVAGAYALAAGPSAKTTRLTGLETLNGKECRRVEVLAAGLRALGIDVRDNDEFLEIGASQGIAYSPPLLLSAHGDHRMAFAFALLGLVRPDLMVSGSACVAKSWPTFWEDVEGAH